MSTLNVFRYTALGLGILVGFKNDLCLKKSAHKQSLAEKEAKELKLVEEAKIEYAKLHPKVVENVTTSSSGPIDLDDKNLDFGTVIINAVESLKQ